MYIRKKDRELFKQLDQALNMPLKWDKFISERICKNNLIIKTKKEYKCTYCNFIFEDKAKVNEYTKCPNCKHIYKVKSDHLKFYDFKDEIAILDKYDKYYILRQFRLETEFRKGKIVSHFCYEYARIIFDNRFLPIEEIVNDNVVGTIGGMAISFREKNSTRWRYFRSYWSDLPSRLIYYPHNLKKILGDRNELKYSQLWELAKHVEYLNLIYIINNYNPSVELLIKLHLYNLATYPNEFKNKKTFEERFMGLPKDYLPFIQKYNLNLDELIALSYLKVKDINYIKKYEGLRKEQLNQLQKYVNLVTLADKTDFSEQKFYEYRDYLDIAKKLKLNMKDRNTLYPKNIKQAHDKLVKEYSQKKDQILNTSIMKRYKKLKHNEFKNKKYIIFPAKDYSSLIEESSQQNNCVRTYAEKIAKGECDIYFMRLLTNQSKSLVTVEVRNNQVVQQRTKNNQNTTAEQKRFLSKWETKILNK